MVEKYRGNGRRAAIHLIPGLSRCWNGATLASATNSFSPKTRGQFMQDFMTSTTPRRGFLGRIATVAAAAGLGAVLPSRLVAEGAPGGKSLDAALDAWFGRITGKHRMIFDAPEPNSGMAAVWPRIYLNTMTATWPGTATAVVILRHAGLALALSDPIWAKYGIGEMFEIKDGDVPAKRNPYATITGLPIPGLGIVELLKSGVLVGACDVALTVFSSGAAKKMGLDANAVKKEWVAGLLPGVQVVPSGVLGVARSQELGCAYCFAG
jgi:intracellular sulfur oxidation DsrE/DsrF family protein